MNVNIATYAGFWGHFYCAAEVVSAKILCGRCALQFRDPSSWRSWRKQLIHTAAADHSSKLPPRLATLCVLEQMSSRVRYTVAEWDQSCVDEPRLREHFFSSVLYNSGE